MGNIRKYEVPQYLHAALRALLPPDDILPSECAERHRKLNSKTTNLSGPWRNEVTPYLVDIMDDFADPEKERVIFVKPTQVGGTQVILNAILYAILHHPGPMLIAEPTDALRDYLSQFELQPMIDECPELKELYLEAESQRNEKNFTNCHVTLATAGSIGDTAMRSIMWLFIDEIDKIMRAAGKEAHQVDLLLERIKTFRGKRKAYLTGTPTSSSGRIWREMEAADVLKHYFVPCPHCGTYQEFKMSNIRFPGKELEDGTLLSNKDRSEQAVYVCSAPGCGGVIEDHHKTDMLIEGEWREVRRNARRASSVAYWINTIYSNFVTFQEVAYAFLEAKDSPEQLQNFTNSWLAEAWEELRTKTSADLVLARVTDVPRFTVPDWAKMITAGVDVQENCLYYTIRAWGDYLTSQCIDQGQVSSLAEIEKIMTMEYRREDGVQMVVDLSLIDAGYSTDEIYEFCYYNAEWAAPVMGNKPQLTYYKLSVIQKEDHIAHGMRLVLADAGKYKDMIHGRLRKENGNGSWMVYKDCDEEYAQQITSEHKIVERKGGVDISKWVKKHGNSQNHLLDCEVYAAAAADVLQVRSLYLRQEGDATEAERETIPEDVQLEQELQTNGGVGAWKV